MSEVPIPEPHDATPRSGTSVLARLMPLLTLVIAFSAIGLAIWEGLENRRHNRLTVLPRVGGEIDAGRDGDSEFVRVGIESTGLGPAVLTRFDIYLDGALQDEASRIGSGRWAGVASALESDHAITQMNAHAIEAGYYLPPGREMVIFEASRPQRAAGDTAAPLMAILDRLAIQICYCSVYGSDCDDVGLTTGDTETQPCPTRWTADSIRAY